MRDKNEKDKILFVCMIRELSAHTMKMVGEGLMLLRRRRGGKTRGTWQTSFDTIPSIDSHLDR